MYVQLDMWVMVTDACLAPNLIYSIRIGIEDTPPSLCTTELCGCVMGVSKESGSLCIGVGEVT